MQVILNYIHILLGCDVNNGNCGELKCTSELLENIEVVKCIENEKNKIIIASSPYKGLYFYQ